MPINKPSTADAFQAGQNKGAGFVLVYASATPEAERQARLAIIQRIPENADAALGRLTTTNYQVDRTIREAILASPDQWQDEAETLVFTSSDQLKVYLGTPRSSLGMPEALKRIGELRAKYRFSAEAIKGSARFSLITHQCQMVSPGNHRLLPAAPSPRRMDAPRT